MDARLIPTVLPVAKKVIQLAGFKEELKRFEDLYGEEGGSMIIQRRMARLKENIAKLEKELGYES